MKLDRNKRYEGFGVVLESSPYRGLWQSTTKHETGAFRAAIDEGIMQMLLDAGHIKPVRETKIVRVSGVVMCVDDYGNPYVDHCTMAQREVIALGLTGKVSKPVTLEFEVEA